MSGAVMSVMAVNASLEGPPCLRNPVDPVLPVEIRILLLCRTLCAL